MQYLSLNNNISLSKDAYLSWCSTMLANRLEKLAKTANEIERKMLMDEIKTICSMT